MAFFGLTALGPQNAFVAARPETYTVSLFDLSEFESAWDQQSRGAAALTLEQVRAAAGLARRFAR